MGHSLFNPSRYRYLTASLTLVGSGTSYYPVEYSRCGLKWQNNFHCVPCRSGHCYKTITLKTININTLEDCRCLSNFCLDQGSNPSCRVTLPPEGLDSWLLGHQWCLQLLWSGKDFPPQHFQNLKKITNWYQFFNFTARVL